MLLSPLTLRSVTEAIIALPSTIFATPPLPAVLHMDIHAPELAAVASTHNVRVDAILRHAGRELLLQAGSRAAAVVMPEPADMRVAPVVTSLSNTRVVVQVRTLRSALDACAKDRPCIRDLAAVHCPLALAAPYLVAATQRCVHGINGVNAPVFDAIASLAGAVSLMYRVLFAALTFAQIGVLVCGAAFSLTFLLVEVSTAAEKMARSTLQCCRCSLITTRET